MIISGDREVPYAAFQLRAAKAASGLRLLGLQGDRPLALFMRNDIAFFEAAAAAGAIGAATVPINWHLKSDEAGYILEDSRAGALVCHGDLLPQIAERVPPDLPVLVVEPPQELVRAYGIAESNRAGHERARSWDAFVDAQVPDAGPPQRGGSMIYTSGTTGVPKGVRRDPMPIDRLAAVDKVTELSFGLAPERHIVVMMNGPMYHSAPYAYGMSALRHRCTIVLEPRFDPEDMLRLIERHAVTHMHMVPTMFVRLLRLPETTKRRYDLSSLRFVVHGAAPCPPEVKRAMIEWWGPVINEYYGSTETGVPVWHSSEEALRKPGTVGRAIAGGVVRIYDAEGRVLGPGEIGEVYMRQTALTDFTYHGNDEARAEIGRDGLVTVGDVGYLDADGYLFLCDRKRDMVISGGVNIYPAEIEAVLTGMPGVRDCAVFGIPDDEYGEQLCAFVEPESGRSLTSDAVREFVRARLAGFKVPNVVRFVDALPREDTGKIFKRRLREPFWEGRARQI